MLHAQLEKLQRKPTQRSTGQQRSGWEDITREDWPVVDGNGRRLEVLLHETVLLTVLWEEHDTVPVAATELASHGVEHLELATGVRA